MIRVVPSALLTSETATPLSNRRFSLRLLSEARRTALAGRANLTSCESQTGVSPKLTRCLQTLAVARTSLSAS